MSSRRKRKASSAATTTTSVAPLKKSDKPETAIAKDEDAIAPSVAGSVARNDCVYCHRGLTETLDLDNQEEEYLACVVCGDNAHQQCAKDNDNNLKPGTPSDGWKCSGCAENTLESSALIRKLSASSSRMARTLLATGQDTDRPLKHSIFNTLILEDDPMDGSRSLRKRKASSEIADINHETSKKPKRLSEEHSLQAANKSRRASTSKGTPVKASSPIPEADHVQVDAPDEATANTDQLVANTSQTEEPEPVAELEKSVGSESEKESETVELQLEANKTPENTTQNHEGGNTDEEAAEEQEHDIEQTLQESQTEPKIVVVAPTPKVNNRYRGQIRSQGRNRDRKNTRARSPSVASSQGDSRPNTRHGVDVEGETVTENPTVLISNLKTFVLRFKLDPAKLRNLKLRKKSRSLTFGAMPSRSVDYSSHAAPFYSLHDREAEELKSKPYGGILKDEDADTSRTLPAAVDRAMFDEARQKAEEEWKRKTEADEGEQDYKNRKISGPPSKIKCINFGGYEIETWYAAPYPEEYSRNRVLYICEFCLKYMSSDYVAWRHKLKCPAKHPPGDEIYRDKSISVFEVDGRKNPVYCQNLCLLAKLFLGSKTLYYDVEPFLFYIMTEFDELGCHFVGYFSKEKRPSSMNNVSCILTLPIRQRKGYGNLLIDFSYLLTRVEKKTGSPEKPLSDMGLVSYRNYWRLVLAYTLVKQKDPLSIADISDETGMTADDIVAALEALRALVRDPVTKTYALRLDYKYLKQCINTWEAKSYVRLNPDALIWTPYIMGRGNLATYDRAPAISTVAPREDEEDVSANPNSMDSRPNGIVTDASQALPNGVPDHEFGLPSVQVNGTFVSGNSQDIVLQTTEEPIGVGSYTALTPTTPQTLAVETPRQKSPSPIPPTRYEVYPPVSGPTRQRVRAPVRSRARDRPAAARRSGKPLRTTAALLAEPAEDVRVQSNGTSSAAHLLNGVIHPEEHDESEADLNAAEEEPELDAEGEFEDAGIGSAEEDADSYHENEEEESVSDDSVAAAPVDEEIENDLDSDSDDEIEPSYQNTRASARRSRSSRSRPSLRGAVNGRQRTSERLRTRGRKDDTTEESDSEPDEDEAQQSDHEEEEAFSTAQSSADSLEEGTEKNLIDSDQDAEGEIDLEDV